MSTRALIAIPQDDGFHYVYCHHDGYPEGVGAMLRNHYNSLAAAKSIIDLGDMSGLGETLESSVFYSRDREEDPKDTCAIFCPDLDSLRAAEDDACAEYSYRWDVATNCWICRDVMTGIERSL